MPFSWEKVIPHKPQMLETAKGWYEKWMRGERVDTSANDAVDTADAYPETGTKVEAYAEPVKIEDVVEVKETTKDVASRLEALEFAGMAQAETVKSLRDQNQTFSARLADMQEEARSIAHQLEEIRSDAEGHRTSVDKLELRMQTLSGDLAKLSTRVTMAVWVAVVGVVGSAVALSLVFMR